MKKHSDFSHAFWQAIRIWLYVKLCKYVKRHKNLLHFIPKNFQKLLVIAALLVGSIFYKILMKIFNYLVCKLYGVKTLSNVDEFFLSDDKKVIIGCYLRA